MIILFWGTQNRVKNVGFHGDKKKCKNCNKEYIPYYLNVSTYDHFCGIPVSQITDTYKSVCPVCGNWEIAQTFRFHEIENTVVTENMQDILFIAAKKDKRKYDFVFMDNLTKEQLLIKKDTSLSYIKEGMKRRGFNPKDLIILEEQNTVERDNK